MMVPPARRFADHRQGRASSLERAMGRALSHPAGGRLLPQPPPFQRGSIGGPPGHDRARGGEHVLADRDRDRAALAPALARWSGPSAGHERSAVVDAHPRDLAEARPGGRQHQHHAEQVAVPSRLSLFAGGGEHMRAGRRSISGFAGDRARSPPPRRAPPSSHV